MALSKYAQEFHIEKNSLNVVICIYQKPLSVADRSPVNHMLEELQLKLKQELDKYHEIHVAFVYQNPSLDAKDFQKLEKETPIYYKEPGRQSEVYNLSHVWMMGMALLEQQQKKAKHNIEHNIENSVENRLYLVTDQKFSRIQVQLIVTKKSGEISMHPRFLNVKFKPILIKSEGSGGDILEEYIKEHGEVYLDNLEEMGE